MKSNYLPKVFFTALIGLSAAGSAFCSSKSDLVPLGDGTYSVVRQANSGLTRDTATLKSEALEDAAKYCADKGKQLKVLSATEMKPIFMTAGYAKAKVVFKALDANDPELTAPVATPGAAVAPVYIDRTVPSGDVYTELTKLDELRQKGILTEKEFQAEKKKVLKRSK